MFYNIKAIYTIASLFSSARASVTTDLDYKVSVEGR